MSLDVDLLGNRRRRCEQLRRIVRFADPRDHPVEEERKVLDSAERSHSFL